jgi:hypothetical protein
VSHQLEDRIGHLARHLHAQRLGLAASYRLGNAIGQVIYEINPNGTLEGTWTIAEKTGVGTETLTPMR